MVELEIIEDPDAAAIILDPIKARLLSELAQPQSAASIAARVGLARQKVNYHLKVLEAHRLVEPAGERSWGGLKERRFVATAASYVVSPKALGSMAADPDRARDRLSVSYMLAVTSRVIREVGDLLRRARQTNKRVATLSIDTEICFRSASDRAEFTQDLADAITRLTARYHDASAPGGRYHRVLVLAHPKPGNLTESTSCQ